MPKQAHDSSPHAALEPVFRIWGWILLIWSLYRYFLHLPEWADEFIFKPVIFVLPVLFYVIRHEKRPLASLGLTGKNFFNSFYIGLGFGVVFALEGMVVNALKYGRLNIQPIAPLVEYGLVSLLIFSVATAFSEELLNRGFLFSRIFEKTKNLGYATFLSTTLFVLLHVPILVTSLKLQGAVLVLFFVTNFMLGLVNNLLFYNTRSLVAPMLVHIFWNMTVALYL
jgi:uncharacterized protein